MIPSLSSGLAKNNKIVPMLVLFSWLFGHFENLVFFENVGKPHTKAVKHDFSQFFKGTTIKYQFFHKSATILTKSEDKPNSRYISKTFINKKLCFVGKIVVFVLFSWDKGDCVDVWMIKISIETNRSGCLLLSKVDNIQKPCLFCPAFSIILFIDS